ncbi:MAG TPA: sulfate ABC transporter substrate-binding protein [Actinomycetota bacterium]
MSLRSTFSRWVALGAVPVLALSACGSGDPASAAADCTGLPETPVISFAAYSTPREVYGKIIPAFVSQWKEEHDDQNVIFQESYGASTTQAANVVAGYEADVVALSLGPDVDEIADAGLITHDWTDQPDGGMVSSSVVVFDVRPGNPLGIEDWDDLAEPGLELLTPDPASSGGARWNLVSAWGSALRGHAGVTADDEAGATSLMRDVLGNVVVFDKSARDSIKNFEAGNGDVAITYENEVLTAQDAGLEDEAVYPPSSVLIENPVAIVDANVDEHCVRPVAEAFVAFLHSDEAKELYTDVGFLRSTDLETAEAGDPANGFPALDDVWDVDEFGGWDELNATLFDEDGVVTQATQG